MITMLSMHALKSLLDLFHKIEAQWTKEKVVRTRIHLEKSTEYLICQCFLPLLWKLFPYGSIHVLVGFLTGLTGSWNDHEKSRRKVKPTANAFEIGIFILFDSFPFLILFSRYF